MEQEFEETKTELNQREEKPFPDDLEGRLNAITNVVNSELKIATLLHLDATPADGSEILARIRSSVGKGIKLVDERCFQNYCKKSLFPIGIVAEEQIIKDNGETYEVGYSLTEAGKTYGIPISSFSLQWCVENDLSLRSVLGSTLSRGKSRSPLNRVMILKGLRNKNMRQADFEDLTKLNNSGIHKHISALQDLGFIVYDSVQEAYKSKGFSKYELIEKVGEPEILTEKKLGRNVWEIIKKLHRTDSDEIFNMIEYKNKGKVSGILLDFEEQGFIRHSGKFTTDVRSNAEITDLGRKFVDEYIFPVEDALSNENSLEELRKNSMKFFKNKEKFRDYLIRGISNYRKISPNINSKSKDLTYSKIIEYVKQNPGKRNKDIAAYTGYNSPQDCLKPLVKSGTLVKLKDPKNKSAVRYYIKGYSEPIPQNK